MGYCVHHAHAHVVVAMSHDRQHELEYNIMVYKIFLKQYVEDSIKYDD